MRDYYTININLPAGIVSPGRLQTVLGLAWEAGVRTARFGARQQLLMTVHYEDLRSLEKSFRQKGVDYEVNTERYPNIISSYCGEEVFRTGAWLQESEYHTVLDCFDYQPRLKVNLSDASQSFTPFFTGNLNFIASPEPHFWFLYVRLKGTNILFRWRDLVYSNDIGRLAKAVEEAMLSEEGIACRDEESLYRMVMSKRRFITQPATQELDLAEFLLPYYEGFNRYGSRTWLGLYRRDEQFSIPFLLDVCALCLKTRIGEICVTPWKSLVIKGIEEKDRSRWSYVLGKHDVNVRHAANELGWQTEDHTEEGTEVKNYVVRYFDTHDTRTYGLCFGVQTRPKSEVFGSVLIRKRPVLTLAGFPLLNVFDIYFTENFNPNSRTYFRFRKGLFKWQLPGQIGRLCQQYNSRRIGEQFDGLRPEQEEVVSVPESTPNVHQCPNCLTVYDQRYGDELRGIQPNVPFDCLPPDYACPTCDTLKAEWTEVTLEMNR